MMALFGPRQIVEANAAYARDVQRHRTMSDPPRTPYPPPIGSKTLGGPGNQPRKDQPMTRQSAVAVLLRAHLPDYALAHVDGDYIDWHRLDVASAMFSSGERALLVLGQHLALDHVNVDETRSFVYLLGAVDRTIRMDVLDALGAIMSELVS